MMHLINSATGKKVNCVITELLPGDLPQVKINFQFDWGKELRQFDVFKLITDDNFIHGIISIQLREDHLHLSLAEAADINKGRQKQFERVAGTLFAYAASIAIEEFEGFMEMFAKTKLIEHYHQTYGFTQIGRSQKMISTPKISSDLVHLYL